VARLVNAYGPTETTIWSTTAEIEPPVTAAPIGTPLANTRAYLLDELLDPAPYGLPGELYLGGAGVARGYHGRPALTAERFVPDPYGPAGGRLYRTGDRVRYAEDGTLEFLGRVDNQVKLRGHRIEPGEVEARLLEHPGVTEAAVVVRGDDDPRLVAYVVSDAAAADLRSHLARTLPAPLVPNAYVALDRMPLTPNGKLDRAALPDPPRPAPVASAPQDRPQPATGLVARIAGIWQEVLRRPDIGPDDDLFDLGGHSLHITQMIARIRRDIGVEVPMEVFFTTPTVTGVASAIERSTR
jgi:acyl-CoA synthetase (AMP-forming)/AMP-acid ligase II/acyl carrier protein